MAVDKMKFDISGLSQLEKSLDQLTLPKFRKAALRTSGKKAMQKVLVDAKKNAPKAKDVSNDSDDSPTQLSDDIKMTTTVNVDVKANKRGKIGTNKWSEMKVTVKTGKATEEYALVAEYGRDKYTIKRSKAFGKDTAAYDVTIGEIEPRPFLGPALHDNKEKVLTDFRRNLTDQIFIQAKKQEKSIKKGGKT